MTQLQNLVGLKVKLKTGEQGIITNARYGFIQYLAPDFCFDGIYVDIDFNGVKRSFDIYTAVVRRKFMSLENQEEYIDLITPKKIFIFEDKTGKINYDVKPELEFVK